MNTKDLELGEYYLMQTENSKKYCRYNGYLDGLYTFLYYSDIEDVHYEIGLSEEDVKNIVNS
jgi:hypothetical protein